MTKFSSKYLNMTALSSISSRNIPSLTTDGVMLLTSFGLILGKIKTLEEDDDNPSIARILANNKGSFMESSEKDGEAIELISDGSMITVKDAVIKYSNNSTININEITVYCDQIIGFTLVNIQDFLNQCR